MLSAVGGGAPSRVVSADLSPPHPHAFPAVPPLMLAPSRALAATLGDDLVENIWLFTC